MRPLIGISLAPASTPERPSRFVLNQAYARAVELAGGIAFLVPTFGDTSILRATFDLLDGVLLPGGADLQPSTYAAARHATTDEGDAAYDDSELALARWALAERKPLLGICRGLQCMNVAAGGTLFQDIADELGSTLPHRFEPRTGLAHTIDVEPDSRLADVLGATEVGVNSLHHQSVRDLAAGFVLTARAPDGVVEGIEWPDHPFALGVQFHPEELVPGHEASERLFAHFVAAAARR